MHNPNEAIAPHPIYVCDVIEKLTPQIRNPNNPINHKIVSLPGGFGLFIKPNKPTVIINRLKINTKPATAFRDDIVVISKYITEKNIKP